MSAWPSSAKIVLSGFGEMPMPEVRRTEMERGPARQELINSRIKQELSFTVQFESKAAADEFLTWYYDVLKIIDYFDFRHPRTRQYVRARFKGGEIGTLTPVTGAFGLTQRTVTVEYIR